MNLKSQITLLIAIALLLPLLSISALSIYNLKAKQEEDIRSYREEEFDKLKMYLKHIVDVGYENLVAEHTYIESEEFLEDYRHYKVSLDSSALSLAEYKREKMEVFLKKLSKIKFDRGEGYFWITDNTLPYPKMVMHPERPALKGVTLSDAAYNVTKGTEMNIYRARAEQCTQKGEAFVDYFMKKPGTDEIINKVSYSRLYPSLKWIISSGFYTDQIDIVIEAKKEALNKEISMMILGVIGFSIVVLIIGLGFAFYFSNNLIKSITKIKEHLQELATGKVIETIESKRKDEIGEMTLSLNSLVKGLGAYTSFAREIGKGDLDRSFNPLSAEDTLGNELLNMRENLKKAEQDKRIRDWNNEGLAVFGELMRKYNAETQTLLNEILKKLISYLKMNQGAAFLFNEDSNELEQVATFAYSRTKHIYNKIPLGEGLVGQCAIERASIYMIDIPEGYIKIRSGLGDAAPQTLFIVPLIHNEILYGVLELAGFQKLEKHEIVFIEKISESIASSVSSVLVNEKTKKLLEQSQQMAEEMRSQEEELRQNQEELEATQEEMRRRQDELERENQLLKNKNLNHKETVS